MKLTDRLIDRFLPYGAPFVEGHEVELLEDGGPYFDRLFSAIDAAERSVYFETYILASDETGRRLGEALIAKAQQGVDVALSFDSLGSWELDRDFIRELREGGVKVLEFSPMFRFRPPPWRARDHRKMCVIDGHIGITGGLNISNEYAPVDVGGLGWRDTGILIKGPAVKQLEAMFRGLWLRNAAEPISPPEPGAIASAVDESEPGARVRFVGSDSRNERAQLRNSYLRAIVRAKHSIRLVNAYFNPDIGIFRALRRAARRGVKVEIILGRATDHPFVLYVSRGLYGSLLKAGVRVYEWNERVLHAKTAVIDDEWSTVGSANLNHRMVFNDLEVNAVVLDRAFAAELSASFERDRAASEEVTLEAWKKRPFFNRVLEWTTGLFRRLI